LAVHDCGKKPFGSITAMVAGCGEAVLGLTLARLGRGCFSNRPVIPCWPRALKLAGPRRGRLLALLIQVALISVDASASPIVADLRATNGIAGQNRRGSVNP